MKIHWKVEPNVFIDAYIEFETSGFATYPRNIFMSIGYHLIRETPRNKELYRKPQPFEGLLTNINLHSISHENCWVDELNCKRCKTGKYRKVIFSLRKE